MRKIEIVVDYDNRALKEVKGCSDNTEIRLREYDYNQGYIVSFYQITGGEPVYLKQEIECPSCGGSGKDDFDLATLADQECAYCDGTGFEKK